MTTDLFSYQCSLCKTHYAADKISYTCPKDGGNLDVLLDYESIRRRHSPVDFLSGGEQSLWRYLPLLPVDDPGATGTPLRAAGGTPVYAPGRLSKALGLPNLWIKDESRNPTASFKDRASSVVVARARQIGAQVIVTASTGNAGAALAGMSAAVGQPAIIFAPRTAPPAKVAQLLIYGARVLLVDGSYDDAFDLTIQAAQEFGWYCRNTGYNPFTAEGKKTAAFEIWEWGVKGHFGQLATRSAGVLNESRKSNLDSPLFSNLHARLSIFVSVGDGNIISGIHKGFKDLLALGWIEAVPRLFGVQAAGSAAIANAFHANSDVIIPVSADTLADSISVDLPRDGVRAVRAARETGGSYIVVEDEDILSAIADLGKVGIFAEPAGATAYAGLVKAVKTGVIGPDSSVMVVNTGNGLKDIKSAMRAAGDAAIIQPTLDAVKQFLK